MIELESRLENIKLFCTKKRKVRGSELNTLLNSGVPENSSIILPKCQMNYYTEPVPVDEHGRLVFGRWGGYLRQNESWKSIEPFYSRMELLRKSGPFTKGYTARSLTNDHEYHVFMPTAFEILVNFGADPGGILEGVWALTKRGDHNYGIKMIARVETNLKN